MPRIATFVLSLACLSLAAPACTQKPAEPAKAEAKDANQIPSGDGAKGSAELPPLPDPIATVNGKAISLAEFKTIYDLKVQKYAERKRDIPPSSQILRSRRAAIGSGARSASSSMGSRAVSRRHSTRSLGV